MPNVTIVIPSYNHACFVCEAIESVLSQTYKDIEIIVVDDGSIDKTKEVLAPYIGDGKIRYIYQENQGLSAARNTGLKAAQGRYIKFLDSDDFLYPEQIEKQVVQIAASDNSFSVSDFCLLRPGGEMVYLKYQPVREDNQLGGFIEVNRGVVHAFLVPKALIQEAGGFDENLTACEDWDLWIRLLQAGAAIKHVPYTGCCYRISVASMSSSMEKMFLQKCKVVEKANAWMLKEENLSRYQTNWYCVESLLKINTQLLEEGIARRMPLGNILPSALRITGFIFRKEKKGIFKAFHVLIGTANYSRLKYLLKVITKKNYRSNLLGKDDVVRFGKIPKREKP